jgi:hypothetical protein
MGLTDTTDQEYSLNRTYGHMILITYSVHALRLERYYTLFITTMLSLPFLDSFTITIT